MKITPYHPSYSRLSTAFKGIRKLFAYTLGCSVSLVDKMCERPPSDEYPDGSGARNFLDSFHLACHTLRQEDREEQAHELARWTSHVAGGFFTPHFEHTGIPENDFIRLINTNLACATRTVDELRRAYFEDGTPHTFTKEQRARLYRQLEDAMGELLKAREFIRTHKAEDAPAPARPLTAIGRHFDSKAV